MEIRLLYVPTCPHRAVAREHLARALTMVRLNAVVREREVGSPEEARRLGMRGSPTILIDGQDPFAAPAEPAALACRLYRSDIGFSGAPSVEQLLEVLPREEYGRAARIVHRPMEGA